MYFHIYENLWSFSHIPFFGKFFEDMLHHNERVNSKDGRHEMQGTAYLIQKSTEGKFQEDSCTRGLRKWSIHTLASGQRVPWKKSPEMKGYPLDGRKIEMSKEL